MSKQLAVVPLYKDENSSRNNTYGSYTQPSIDQIQFTRQMRFAFRQQIYVMWLKHGANVLERLAVADPEAFAKLYLACLPKEATISIKDAEPAEPAKQATYATSSAVAFMQQLDTIRKTHKDLESVLSETPPANEYAVPRR